MLKTSRVLLCLVFFLCGCASYNEKIAAYYKQISEGNYVQANTELNKNKLLQRPRNQLLYLMEKGRSCQLMGAFEESNTYFNQADSLLESGGLSGTADAIVGTLVNPMTQTYKGEDFEKFMIHYYKALNYLHLGKKKTQ